MNVHTALMGAVAHAIARPTSLKAMVALIGEKPVRAGAQTGTRTKGP